MNPLPPKHRSHYQCCQIYQQPPSSWTPCLSNGPEQTARTSTVGDSDLEKCFLNQYSSFFFFSSFFSSSFLFVFQLREKELVNKTDTSTLFSYFHWNHFFGLKCKLILESHIFMSSHKNEDREEGEPWSEVYIGHPTESITNCIEKIPKDPRDKFSAFPLCIMKQFKAEDQNGT